MRKKKLKIEERMPWPDDYFVKPKINEDEKFIRLNLGLVQSGEMRNFLSSHRGQGHRHQGKFVKG